MDDEVQSFLHAEDTTKNFAQIGMAGDIINSAASNWYYLHATLVIAS